MKALLLVFFAAILVACPPSPTPPGPDSGDAAAIHDASPPPMVADAAPASVYVDACMALNLADCPEGKTKNCAEVMEKAQVARQTDFRPDCLKKQTTKAGVRACGPGVKCP